MRDDPALTVDPAGAGDVWSVDADAPLQSVLDRPDTPPLLRQALTGVLPWQTRNETPVRRTLTAPRLAPQWAAALLALGATVTVVGDDGPMEVPLESVLQRQAKGVASALHVELGSVRWGEARVARTPADEPIVSAIAVVGMDDPSASSGQAPSASDPRSASGQGGVVRQARVALTGAWPEPARLAKAPARLVGGPLDAERIQAVADGVAEEVDPRGDFLGSEEYRRAMASVTTRRALEACLRQEVGDE
jgi:CO/xanthine dehydrogenase FAD-binding subunit